MARLIKDSNTNAAYGHSAAAMKKVGLKFSGRKPLGCVSNSANPFLKKASEKMVRKKNFAVIEDKNGNKVKKNISKASGTRKVLADISNSIRHQTSRKEQNTEKRIAYEEYDPHDHQACIKARECKEMNMDDFLNPLRLANGCPKELPSLERPETPPMTPPMKLPMSPLIIPQSFLEEMLEWPILDRPSMKFDFSPPESPGHYFKTWELNLIDSPKLVKH